MSGGHAPVILPAGGSIGVFRASALYISAVLGTGILILPTLASNAAGPASILAVAAVLLLSIPLAGTFAALAARYPDAGGVATFVRLALGPTAARATGYWFFFGVTAGAPVLAIVGGQYLASATGASRDSAPILAIAFLAVPIALSFFGLRVSGAVQLVLTAILLVTVIGVVALSSRAVHSANFAPFLPHGWSGVGVAMSLLVWAFAGWEAVTHLAPEFTRPTRTIPLATAVAVAVVGVLYIALQVVTVGVLGTSRSSSRVPLIDLVSVSVPGIGPAIVAAITAIVAVGVLNSYIPAFANLAASLGRDGDLPRLFAKGAEPGSVPRRALLLWSAVALVYFVLAVASGLDLRPFILVNTASTVVVYLVGMIAAVILLDRWSVGWWMGLVSVVLLAGLLLLEGASLLVPGGLAVVAVVVTLVKSRMRSAAR